MVSQVRILSDYRDKSFVFSILCHKTVEFYSIIKTSISFPLILTSGLLTVLNSSDINSNDMKFVNIIINATTTLLLGFSNNFKIAEKVNLFRSLNLKFTKLTHLIEDKLSNNNFNEDTIRDIILQYDGLNELMEFSIPKHIKNKVRDLYKKSRVLPNILNCETAFIETLNGSERSPAFALRSSVGFSSKNDKVKNNQSVFGVEDKSIFVKKVDRNDSIPLKINVEESDGTNEIIGEGISI